MIEQLELKINDKSIRGVIHNPINWNNKVIIVLNGYRTAYTDASRWQKLKSDFFCEKGFVVVRFDYLGYGESDGDFKDSNLTTMANDLRQVINYVNERFNEPQLILEGGSMGAAVTMIVANENTHSNITNVILQCPALDFYNIYMSGFKEHLRLPMTDIEDPKYVEFFEGDAYQYKDLLNEHKYKGDSLIILHDRDQIIDNEKIGEYAIKNNIELYNINEADHFLMTTHVGPKGLRRNQELRDELMDVILKYLSKY